MATTTPNFGWPVPTSTDLVKDGATAIEALGDSIDASLLDLKGGTTGQVLAKTTNTDMDFVWVTTDDANAIQNSIVDAKGDLIAATANDTPARLAVGNNGETLVANSAAASGLQYNANYAAGKNVVINGAMNVWQRGITFNSAADGAYTADRFQFFKDGTATCNVTQTTFVPGAAPVAGYESQYYLTLTPASYTSGNVGIRQNIEDVRTFAGQTINISFYAKASTSTSNTILYLQNFGSGGSASVNASAGTVTIGTGWSRHTVSVTLPSVSGKTIGTSSYLMIQFLRYASSATIDIWGVQVEAGSVVTAFQTASGSLGGELALCQRYLPSISGVYSPMPGFATSTTSSFTWFTFPVTPRVVPTGITVSSVSHFSLINAAISAGTPTAIAFDSFNNGVNAAGLTVTTTAASPTLVQGQGVYMRIVSASGSILFTGCEL